MYSSTQFDDGRRHGQRVWLRWWKLYWLASAVCCLCIFCSLSSALWLSSLRGVRSCGGHLVSVLAWACLGCSFLGFGFQVLIKSKNDWTKPKTSLAGLLGINLALWPTRGSESSYLIFVLVFSFKTLRLNRPLSHTRCTSIWYILIYT